MMSESVLELRVVSTCVWVAVLVLLALICCLSAIVMVSDSICASMMCFRWYSQAILRVQSFVYLLGLDLVSKLFVSGLLPWVFVKMTWYSGLDGLASYGMIFALDGLILFLNCIVCRQLLRLLCFDLQLATKAAVRTINWDIVGLIWHEQTPPTGMQNMRISVYFYFV